ncbi:MAG: WYL domain-containing protein [Clostridia bacterium]|nr:WYL domain-containing protein [Clostridia bacterium]
MSNIHRIIWFDQEVRGKKYPNSIQISNKFEISVRQAARDIEYLKNSLNAPLRYVAKMRGFEYEDEAFVLPNIYITEEEKNILYYLAYKYSNYDDTPNTLHISKLFSKLTGQHKAEVNAPVFDIDKHKIETINVILTAIAQNMKLGFLYADPLKGNLQLTVHPYKIFRKYNMDYLAAFCEENMDEAVYRLDRIKSIKSKCGEHYKKDPKFSTRKYTSEYCLECYVARIEFDNNPESFLSKYVDIKHITDHIYDIEFSDVQEFILLLLSDSHWTKIHSPNWLIEKLKNHCNRVLDKL